LAALAREHGTPFYLYDADLVRRRVAMVRAAFLGQVDVYFAVKANPNLELLKSLAGTADGLDISSVGELEQALLAGFDAASLSFAGPGKSAAELQRAVDVGVGGISVESMRELQLCAELSEKSGRRAHVLLRVNPSRPNRAFGIKMGGRAVQFGIEEAKLPVACEFLRANRERLDFAGVHIYAGSQAFDSAALAETVEDSLRIAREVQDLIGSACRKVNLGGGFGIAQGGERKALDVAEAARRLNPVFEAFVAKQPSCRPLFELGRFLVADAGIYVSRVVSFKESLGKRFVVVDGGLHHHLAAAGTFGAALRTNFPLLNLSRPEAPVERCNVAGPSCNPTDLLGVDVELPRPEIGDLIAVQRSGSYGFTASPLLFLGRPTAVELVRRDGTVVVGRRRFTMADFN
jgi:diaminopimelate decarboxylase